MLCSIRANKNTLQVSLKQLKLIMGSTIALLFEYLVSTKTGYAIIAFFSILLFYALFKITMKIIDYILFKKLTAKILDAVYNNNEEFYDENNNFNDDEDETQMRDKEQERQREFEKKQNMENNANINNKVKKKKNKIVGLAKPIGKWTNHAVRKWMKENKDVNMDLASEVGYFQAKFLADQEKQDLGGQIGGR